MIRKKIRTNVGNTTVSTVDLLGIPHWNVGQAFSGNPPDCYYETCVFHEDGCEVVKRYPNLFLAIIGHFKCVWVTRKILREGGK